MYLILAQIHLHIFQLGTSNWEKDKYLKKRKNSFWNQYEIVQFEIRED